MVDRYHVDMRRPNDIEVFKITEDVITHLEDKRVVTLLLIAHERGPNGRRYSLEKGDGWLIRAQWRRIRDLCKKSILVRLESRHYG